MVDFEKKELFASLFASWLVNTPQLKKKNKGLGANKYPKLPDGKYAGLQQRSWIISSFMSVANHHLWMPQNQKKMQVYKA